MTVSDSVHSCRAVCLTAPADVQIPVELILGPVGALALAMLWIMDLRKERDLLKERLYKLLDKIDVAAKADPR